MRTDSSLAVEVEGLHMRYGDREVLGGIDLVVHRGEILGLLGPNGAGKTTTIEILEGFRRRTSGEVRVLGEDPEHADEEWRARIGIVLQTWRDHGRWRVRELLHHLGRYYRPYHTRTRSRPLDADNLLEQLGLTGQASTVVRRLSGGQRRRLDVAIGLVGNPELLFLDEPTVGFDPEARYDFHQLIQQVSSGHDTSIILTTHDLSEAEKLSDRIAILIDGEIATDATPLELKSRLTGTTIVRYRQEGRAHTDNVSTPEVERHVLKLLTAEPSISSLEVARPHLEDTYLSMVRGAREPQPGTGK